MDFVVDYVGQRSFRCILCLFSIFSTKMSRNIINQFSNLEASDGYLHFRIECRDNKICQTLLSDTKQVKIRISAFLTQWNETVRFLLSSFFIVFVKRATILRGKHKSVVTHDLFKNLTVLWP